MQRTFASLIFLTLIVVQFNNCDVYSQKNVFEREEVIKHCLDTGSSGCFKQEAEMLEIRINTENDLKIGSTKGTIFYVSGDCNEGNFPDNKIEWKILADSASLAQDAATYQSAVCVNGRYNAKIVLPSDLATSGTDYKVEVELIGIDIDGLQHTNPFLAKSSIFIIPQST